MKPWSMSTFLLQLAFYLLAFGMTQNARAQSKPELKTATNHPIQYYLSLPEGWVASKKWPVVIVIESAERDFLQAETAFAQARQRQPFILVTPLVVTNGGAGFRSVPTYHYSDEVWNRIQSEGQFKFDLDGITAIMQDMQGQYGGENRFFIAGLEAAGHTVWGVLFNHPEITRGAALVCPNYLGRWIDESHISSAKEKASLPIQNMIGSRDEMCLSGQPIYTQIQRAITVARANGYHNVSLVQINGKGHERLASEVLAYFSSLMK